MESIRCPHCGSTAQPKPIGTPTLSDNKEVLSDRFRCGCGCQFVVDYVRVDNIWEPDWIEIEFPPEKNKKS